MKKFFYALVFSLLLVPLVSAAQNDSSPTDITANIILSGVEVSSNPLFIIESGDLYNVLNQLSTVELQNIGTVKVIKITDANNDITDLVNMSIYKQESVLSTLASIYKDKLASKQGTVVLKTSDDTRLVQLE